MGIVKILNLVIIGDAVETLTALGVENVSHSDVGDYGWHWDFDFGNERYIMYKMDWGYQCHTTM
jgi:hypothetical protein